MEAVDFGDAVDAEALDVLAEAAVSSTLAAAGGTAATAAAAGVADKQNEKESSGGSYKEDDGDEDDDEDEIEDREEAEQDMSAEDDEERAAALSRFLSASSGRKVGSQRRRRVVRRFGVASPPSGGAVAVAPIAVDDSLHAQTPSSSVPALEPVPTTTSSTPAVESSPKAAATASPGGSVALVAARARAQIKRAQLLSIAAERAAGAPIGIAVQRAVRAHPDGAHSDATAAEFEDEDENDASTDGKRMADSGILSILNPFYLASRAGAALDAVELPYALGSVLSTATAIAVGIAALAAMHQAMERLVVPRS